MAPSSRASRRSKVTGAERDPTGQYVRYRGVLGIGASKTVFKAFDEGRGIEVAWSKTTVTKSDLQHEKNYIESLTKEGTLLKSLRHGNIMRCYSSWFDSKELSFNMITEKFSSGNLIEYRKKHDLGHESKLLRNWARQILSGIDYLHRHDPPILHRDIKCENIFVNGNSGEVKIGDFGLAMFLEEERQKFVATPRFMAPEASTRNYNQLVDIFSFGMCLIQMVTGEIPYSNVFLKDDIYEKVKLRIEPRELLKVTDPEVTRFIRRCLAPVSWRPAAIDLLNDPFFAFSDSECSSPIGTLEQMARLPGATPQDLKKEFYSGHKIFKLQGRMMDQDSVSVTLLISDSGGNSYKVEFVLYVNTDTAQPLVQGLGLSNEEVELAAQLTKKLILELVPASSSSSKAHLKLKNKVVEEPISVEHQDPRDIPETSSAPKDKRKELAMKHRKWISKTVTFLCRKL